LQSTSDAASSGILDLKLDPTGRKKLIVASTKPPNELLLFDLNSGEYKVLAGHDDTVTRVSFVNDGDGLISASYDKTVRLWDANDGSLLHTFAEQDIIDEEGNVVHHQGHNDKVVCLAAHKSNSHICASAALDKLVILWNCQYFDFNHCNKQSFLDLFMFGTAKHESLNYWLNTMLAKQDFLGETKIFKIGSII
jgi:WD40 repeat protein